MTMRARNLILITLIFSMLFMVSCRKNSNRVNVSPIKLKVEVKRLEKDIFSLDPEKIPSEVPSLKAKYGAFLQLFSYAISTGDINDPSFGDFLVRFCTDKLNYEVYSSVIKEYPDIEQIRKGIEDGFRHYRYYFPARNIPAVYTCTSGFNYSVFTSDSLVGIGLDRYLGNKYDYYKRLQIYNYLAARMNSRYIVPDVMYGWGSREWDFSAMKYPADNVMSEMIHLGKLKYFEKCMLPEVNDSIIFGFTGSQLKFCSKNEDQMWLYIIEQNLLFSTDRFVIRKLTDEAPFTSFFSSESPGRAAVWIGFRIVESYMMKNRNVTLEELMNNTDVQSILEKARYSPR
jgi:hypothetical protein